MTGVLGCSPSPVASGTPEPAGETVFATVLHVNDSHGRIEPHIHEGESVGGYSRLATLAGDIRSQSKADRVFLVHAGDIFTRGDPLTRRTLGAANVTLMNQIGFDFWTPGNGEYYDGVPNLRKRIAEARFDVLAANVILKTSGAYISRPYVIAKAGPMKIAFFGLCFVRTDRPEAAPLNVEDPIETARKLVPKLREQADAVVLVTHMGLRKDEKLAATVGGIDLIIGGHSHNTLPNGRRVKGPDGREVLIVQAGDHLRFLGRVNLKFQCRGQKYQLIEASAKLVPLDASIQESAKVKALIAKLNEASTRPASAPLPQ